MVTLWGMVTNRVVTLSLLKLIIRYTLPFSITLLNVAMEHAVELIYQLKLILALVSEANAILVLGTN